MPPSRRQKYRRRRITAAIVVTLLLAVGIYVPATLLAPIPAVGAEELAPPAPSTPVAQLAFPGYGASAVGAVGYEEPLATNGSADPLPIASITKVITALVVLEAKPLAPGESGESISLTQKDARLVDAYRARNGKVLEVAAGTTLTQRQVLEIMLVYSANNYTETMVDWVFGSMSGYLDAARVWLSENGFTQTTVEDCTGMSPGNRSTASELLRLAKLALENPVIAEIVAMPAIEVPGIGRLSNTNELLGEGGVRGIKTGTLDEAGACILFAADISVGDRIITVVGSVLGAEDHATLRDHVRTLLASVTSGFTALQLTAADVPYAEYETRWGDEARAVTAEPASVVVWSDAQVQVDVEAEPVGTAEAGDAVGTVTFTVEDQEVVVRLVLDAPIDDPGFAWRISNPLEVF